MIIVRLEAHTGHAVHRGYELTCREYEALRQESAGLCDLCQRPCDRMHIDHEHGHPLGGRAVRGLLCPACNVRMGLVDADPRLAKPLEREYLAHPWHVRVGIEPLP